AAAAFKRASGTSKTQAKKKQKRRPLGRRKNLQKRKRSGFELLHTRIEPRHFPRGGIPMKNPALRGAHDHGLCLSKRLARLLAVSGADRFLDRADIGGVTRAALFVDRGLARDLARRFFSGSRIGHA